VSRLSVSSIVVWASRHRVAVLVGVMCAMLASAEGIRRLSFDADILALLPQNGRVTPAFREFLSRFGTLDQLYIVFTAPDGYGIADYREDIDAWVEQLRQAPEIVGVDAGVLDRSRDFGWLAGRQLLLLPDESLDEALRRLEPAGLARAVAESRELLTVPSSEIAELVRQDPAGLLTLLRPVLSGTDTGLGGDAALNGYITGDGLSRVVMARPRRPPFDSAFSRALDERLRSVASARRTAAAAEDDDEPRPPMRVEFAGGHRVSLETEALVRRESIVNTVGSLAVILPMLFVLFRSVWLVLVGALPAAISLVLVLGGLGFLGTRLSAAGTGASAMLFGLGIDGVVLLYVAHLLPSTETAPVETASRISGPAASMLLGMWTTAATFYGLMFVDFPSLQQLGMLVGHSMVICGVLTLLLVPALLPRQAPRARVRALTLPALPIWIAAHRRAIVVAAVALTCVLGAASTRLRVDPSLERLRSVTDAAKLEARINSAFGLPATIYVVLAEGADLDPLLETNERLTRRIKTELPGLRVQAPTSFLPSAASQARATDRIARSGLSVAAVRSSLERATIQSGFRPGSFAPFAGRLPDLLDTAQRLRYEDYVSHNLNDLIARFVVRDAGRWQLATYLLPSNDDDVARIQAIVDQVDPRQTLTGLPLVNRDLAQKFVPEFFTGLSIGALLVVLLVVVAFRDWRLSLFALVPTALGLAWTGGILALAGIELDLFAAFAVVTLLGIGVDYGVHLVHRHQERGDAAAATAELTPVILVAAAITILGYGTLVTSSYPPLRSIGLVSVVSVVALAAASVLVLPALLLTRPVQR
jgi:uncharacterized protein